MPRLPHVVWINLDSVRYDHTTMAGYGRDTTPEMASVGREDGGMAATKCFAHGKYTLSSTASMLTGTYPSRNQAGYEHEVLPAELPTVPELFAQAGYFTSGVSANRYVSGETGLDRDFDDFLWLHPSTLFDSVSIRTILRYGLNLRRHSAGYQRNPYKHATPYLMNRAATDWLGATDGGEPFFLFVHYNEPHRPYYPPLPYLDTYADATEMTGREAAEFSLEVHENLERIVATGCDLSSDEMAALVAMYDAEIRYTDEMVGRMVDRVRAHDDRDVIVVLTSDHGELFGEYGLLGHKFVVHDELTHVPLVTSGVEGVPSDGFVQHADVMTTVLAQVGADTEPLDGIDLREERRDHVVSQDHGTDFTPFLEHEPNYDVSHFHEGDVTALRTEEFRYQESNDRAELFELPDETTDVSDDHPEITADLAATLDEWFREYGTPVEAERTGEYSADMREHLADMGYL